MSNLLIGLSDNHQTCKTH